MREVECVLDPSSGMGDLGGVGMMGFGNGLNRRSWIDMLVRLRSIKVFVLFQTLSMWYSSILEMFIVRSQWRGIQLHM